MVLGNPSSVAKVNSKPLLVIPGAESCLLPCCLCQEYLKANLFLSPAKFKFLVPSNVCIPHFSCVQDIAK